MIRPGSEVELSHNESMFRATTQLWEINRIMIIGDRERANLVVQLARFFYIYIYIYPALMYAVMFYVILNKRKRLRNIFVSIRALHIP